MNEHHLEEDNGEELYWNYYNEHHDLIVKNSNALEAIILKVSLVVIGGLLTLSKFSDATYFSLFYLKFIIPIFAINVIASVISYLLANKTIEIAITQASEYYRGNGKIPDIDNITQEIIRKKIDLYNPILFCIGLILFIFVFCQN